MTSRGIEAQDITVNVDITNIEQLVVFQPVLSTYRGIRFNIVELAESFSKRYVGFIRESGLSKHDYTILK